MKKEYFDKLKKELADKYSKDELAKLLVKHKTKRISNLLCAAFNSKTMSLGDKYTGYIPYSEKYKLYAKEHFEMVKRVIGPGTQLYMLHSVTPKWKEVKGQMVMDGTDKTPINKIPWHKYIKQIGGEDLSDENVLRKIWEVAQIEALKEIESTKKEKNIQKISKYNQFFRRKSTN